VERGRKDQNQCRSMRHRKTEGKGASAWHEERILKDRGTLSAGTTTPCVPRLLKNPQIAHKQIRGGKKEKDATKRAEMKKPFGGALRLRGVS